MKKIITTIAVFTSLGLYAQNNVGIGTLTPNSNAKLEIKSDDKGVLITRLTTVARNTLGTALTATEDGMLVYDKDLTAFYYWDGPNLQWVQVGSGAGDNWGTQSVQTAGTNITGDGTTANPLTVTDGDSDATNEIELPATATTGQVLSWDGTSWVAQNAVSGADNWGTDIVNTAGTNITGDGTTANPITVTDGDSDATNEIELPTGGTNGQLLATDGSGVYTWVSDDAGTDDQNIANLAFDNTTNVLTIGIENGTSQTIDLTDLINDADSDITNEIQDLSITNNILTITNNGTATNIDLSSYLDNTDNQDLSLAGNTLSLTNDGTNVDLSGYMDNTDTQNISGSGLAGTTLTIGIQNGTNETIDLSTLVDHDWYKVGTTSAPTTINDNIFTQGNVGIGINTPTAQLEVSSAGVFLLKLNHTSNLITNVAYQNVIGFFDGAGNRMGYLGDGGPVGKNMQVVGNEDYGIKLQSVSSAADYRAEIYLNNNVDTSITFKTKNATRMFIEPNGNVGVGTITPSSKLQVVDYYDTTLTITPFTNFGDKLPGISIYETTDFVGLTTVDKDNNQGTTNDKDGMLYWGDDGGTEDLRFTYMKFVGTSLKPDDKMIIKGNGNVGIGTTTPSEKLTISSSNTSGHHIALYTAGDNDHWSIMKRPSTYATSPNDFHIAYNDGSNWSSFFSINPNGNVGVSTQVPTNKLDINGDLRVRTITTGTSTEQQLVVDATGVVKKIAPSSPAGEVITFAGATAPTGFLMCDGSAVSRTTYADLFAVIGTTYGTGNGTTTFTLPDLRGEFIRGFDAGRGADPSRVFGSSQEGTIVSGGDDNNTGQLSSVGVGNLVFGDPLTAGQLASINGKTWIHTPQTNSLYVWRTPYSSARPRNIAMNYCIRF